MTAFLSDIKGWIKKGQDHGASHVVIVHDHYDHDNFPLLIEFGDDPTEVFLDKYHRNRKPNEASYSADECYDLTLNVDSQLKERRANHWTTRTKKKGKKE